MGKEWIELDSKWGSSAKLEEAFKSFLNQPKSYTQQFLQSKYNLAFDGYSFMGQEDSLNQYDSDLLHSFVLSDLQDYHNFPDEFHDFFETEWENILKWVVEVEEQRLKDLNRMDLLPFYRENMGHMISCNYYPATYSVNHTAKQNTRLSAHTDVSLFTVFPFGVSTGLATAELRENVSSQNSILFNGYFCDFITEGEEQAFDHIVELPKNVNQERFSFAFFSIPKPESIIQTSKGIISGKEYYEQYLSIF